MGARLLPRRQLPRPMIGAIALCICAIAACGCASSKSKKSGLASWDVRQKLGWKSDVPEPETPTRLVTTWTDTTLSRPGQPTKRGFGGRLVFFNQESEDPVRVEGQLVVYAFDETDRPSHETHPTRRYIFPAEQFARHESTNKLGPSYSIWLPWDEAGGEQRRISIIARFEPKEGPLLVGEQTRHLLPGSGTTMLAEASRGVPAPGAPPTPPLLSEIQQLSYNPAQPAAESSIVAASGVAPVPEKKKMTTATIAIPSRLATTMQQAPQSQRLAEMHTHFAGPVYPPSDGTPHRADVKSSIQPGQAQAPAASTPSIAAPRDPLGPSRGSLREKLPVPTTPDAPLIPDRAR